MNLTDYLIPALDVLINDTFVIDSTTVECVFNQSSHQYGGKQYGFPSGDTNLITFRTADFPNIKSYKGQKLLYDNQEYRITKIVYGKYATTLEVTDAKAL